MEMAVFKHINFFITTRFVEDILTTKVLFYITLSFFK